MTTLTTITSTTHHPQEPDMTSNQVHSIRSATRMSAALLLLGAVATSAHAQLVDGTFGNALVPFSAVLGTNLASMAPGKWGQENSTITGVVGSVIPLAPTTMLSMFNSGGVTTQAGQAIDLAPYAAMIASGAQLTFGAFFNAASAGPVGGVGVSFFSSAFYNSILPPTFSAVASAVNGTPGDWEQKQVTVMIPTTAAWMLAQVYYSNATLSTVNGQSQPGYVDEAYLRITPVPEPASWALMGLGALGVAWRQRARRQYP